MKAIEAARKTTGAMNIAKKEETWSLVTMVVTGMWKPGTMLHCAIQPLDAMAS